jgi:hypothetical protein
MDKLTAEEAYAFIKKEYGPMWPDTPAEKAGAIMKISDEIRNRNPFFSNKEKISAKCKAAAGTHGTKRCKISTLVQDEFWDMTFVSEMTPPELILKRRNRQQI